MVQTHGFLRFGDAEARKRTGSDKPYFSGIRSVPGNAIVHFYGQQHSVEQE